MTMDTVLLVDDAIPFINAVREGLRKDQTRVLVASNGFTAVNLLQAERVDIIILNLALPQVSGLDISLILLKKGTIPLILLTGRDETSGRIIGEELGADDYIFKPFNAAILLARTSALLKKKTERRPHPPVLYIGDLAIDNGLHRVRCGERNIELTPTEYRLLAIMAADPGHIYSRDELIDCLKKESRLLYERTIDSHIMNLRKKIEPDPARPRYIISVYGSGYKAGTRSMETQAV